MIIIDLKNSEAEIIPVQVIRTTHVGVIEMFTVYSSEIEMWGAVKTTLKLKSQIYQKLDDFRKVLW